MEAVRCFVCQVAYTTGYGTVLPAYTQPMMAATAGHVTDVGMATDAQQPMNEPTLADPVMTLAADCCKAEFESTEDKVYFTTSDSLVAVSSQDGLVTSESIADICANDDFACDISVRIELHALFHYNNDNRASLSGEHYTVPL